MVSDDAAVDAHVQAVATDWKTADLSEADQALCEFADKLTTSPQGMTQRHVETLRNHGFDDVAIHDAAQVIGYFNYINRVADALHVDEEPDVRPWGSSALSQPRSR